MRTQIASIKTRSELSRSPHQPFVPVSVYRGEGLVTGVRSAADSAVRNLQVWRLSPLAVEVVVEGPLGLRTGEEVDLELRIGQQTICYRNLVVGRVSEENGRNIAAIALSQHPSSDKENGEKRRLRRWGTCPRYFPVARASNPARYDDMVFFCVRNLSAGGSLLVTSLRNKHLVTGMRLRCVMSFPDGSQVKMACRVSNCRIVYERGRKFLALGVEFVEPRINLKRSVGQYVLQFGAASSLQAIRAENLVVQTTAAAVDFCYVRTHADYRSVLRLRRKAYAAVGKVAKTAALEDMSDVYDARSRLIMGVYRGRVVASCRLVFNRIEDRMEQEAYVRWPSALPRRNEMVEVMRACTDPQFRGSDLLPRMFRFVALSVMQSKRRYIVLSATQEMRQLYANIGFSDVGLSYPLAALNNSEHFVYLANVPAALQGKNVHPLYWGRLWSDVARYMLVHRYLKIGLAGRIRMAILRMAEPIGSILQRWLRRPQRSAAQAKAS